MTEITIDTTTPVPPKKTGKRKPTELFIALAALEVGESFSVPLKENVNYQRSYISNVKRKAAPDISLRMDIDPADKDKLRVWRRA